MTPDEWAAERVTHLEAPPGVAEALRDYLAAQAALDQPGHEWETYWELSRACGRAGDRLRAAFGPKRGRFKVGGHVVALNAMVGRGEDLQVWPIWERGTTKPEGGRDGN